MQITNPGHDFILFALERPLLGITDQAFEIIDGDTHADTGRLIDLVGFARFEGQLSKDLFDESRHLDLAAAPVHGRGFLLHDRQLVLHVLGIVGANLHVKAVLQRRDNAAAAGIILRIGAGDDHHIQGEPDFVTLYLNVFFFHQVKQTHLYFFGKVGQFINREDATVRARHETIVNRFLIGKITPFGHFDRIDFTHQIGNGNIRGCQFFAVSGIAIDPLNRRVIAQLLKLFATGTANRMVRIVVDFTALNDWNAFIQQVHQAANDARLALTAFSEEDHMVSRQDGVFYFGNDRFIVAYNPRQNPFFGFEAMDEILAHLLANRQN